MDYRQININDWVKQGEGGTATSYYHKTDNTIMLKLFTGNVTSANYALKELRFSQNVAACGISTPKALEVVKTAEGKIGVIYERITNKISFSRLCVDNPEKIEEYAAIFADELKALHQIQCNTGFFPSVKTTITACIEANKVFRGPIKEKLLAFVDELGEETTCLHGDPHSGNIIDSDGKRIWIDLGAFGFGSPWYDIGAVYFFYYDVIGVQIAKPLLHMNSKQLKRFWKQFVYTYSGCKTEEEYTQFAEKARKSCLLFSIYTMDVEHYHGVTAFLASVVIKHLSYKWY